MMSIHSAGTCSTIPEETNCTVTQRFPSSLLGARLLTTSILQYGVHCSVVLIG